MSTQTAAARRIALHVQREQTAKAPPSSAHSLLKEFAEVAKANGLLTNRLDPKHIGEEIWSIGESRKVSVTLRSFEGQILFVEGDAASPIPGLIWNAGVYEGYDPTDFDKPARSGLDVLAEAVVRRLEEASRTPGIKHL